MTVTGKCFYWPCFTNSFACYGDVNKKCRTIKYSTPLYYKAPNMVSGFRFKEWLTQLNLDLLSLKFSVTGHVYPISEVDSDKKSLTLSWRTDL